MDSDSVSAYKAVLAVKYHLQFAKRDPLLERLQLPTSLFP